MAEDGSREEMKRQTSPLGSESVWNTPVARGLIIAVYLGLNISLNMLNKWTLSLYGFKFPLFMSLAHMAFSFLALLPIMFARQFRDLHVPTWQKQWMGIVAISTFFAVNVGFNNISLLSIPLSLNQVIRACIPVVAAVGSVFIEKKTPTRNELLGLFVIVFGVVIAVYEGSDSKASVIGIILCILGTVSNGLMMSSIGKLMSEKLDVLRLTFYTAPLTCIVLLPFYFNLEAADFRAYDTTSSNGYIGLLLLGCVNALAYNLIHSFVIKITSAVTTTVIGEMKIVLILLLSSFVLGESEIWTIKMLVGCITAILGFIMYSHAKLSAPPASFNPVIKGIPELTPLLSTEPRSASGSVSSQGSVPKR